MHLSCKEVNAKLFLLFLQYPKANKYLNREENEQIKTKKNKGHYHVNFLDKTHTFNFTLIRQKNFVLFLN